MWPVTFILILSLIHAEPTTIKSEVQVIESPFTESHNSTEVASPTPQTQLNGSQKEFF